jgi:NAD(P)-dependent dehydrogenase (short-subunit alcohol dehydrogenase family)
MSKTLIVGGTKGIGLEIANLMADKECVIFSRSESLNNNPKHTHYKLDVLNNNYPEIEGLSQIIYCPGTINLKPFRSLKIEDFQHDFNINFLSAVKVIQHYQRALSKSPDASIVLFSTVAVKQGMNFHASIASAKGAVEGLTKSLAAEFAGKIRVNCIAPSLTDTPLAQSILRNEDAIKRSNEMHPSKRINTASDVAKTAEFLLQDNNITGQIIHVDGGMSTLKV